MFTLLQRAKVVPRLILFKKFSNSNSNILRSSLQDIRDCAKKGQMNSALNKLDEISNFLEKLRNNTSIEMISDIIFEVRAFSSAKPEVKRLLSHCTIMVDKLISDPASISPIVMRDLHNLLYGLRYCHSTHKEVALFINSLTNYIAESDSFNVTKLAHMGITPSSISLLYGFQSMSLIDKEGGEATARLLHALLPVLQHSLVVSGSTVSTANVLTPLSLCQALYGLQNMNISKSSDSSSILLREILKIIQKYADLLVSSSTLIKNSDGMNALGVRGVGMMMFGIRYLNSNDIVMQDLLKSIKCVIDAYYNGISKVGTEPKEYSARSVGKILKGLQSMSSDDAVVRDVIMTILPIVRNVEATEAQIMSPSVFFGFQNMTNESECVQQLLVVTSDLVAQYKDELLFEDICEAVYGLRRLSLVNAKEGSGVGLSESRSTNIKHVLKTINTLMNTNGVSISGNQHRNVMLLMLGLQNMSSEMEEVRGLVKSITVCLHTVVQNIAKNVDNDDLSTLSGSQMASILYGCNKLSSKYPEVLDMMDILYELIKKCSRVEPLSTQQLSMMLHGLQNMSNEEIQVNRVLQQVLERAPAVTPGNCVEMIPYIGLAMSGMRSMTDRTRESRELLRYFTRMLDGMCSITLSKEKLKGSSICMLSTDQFSRIFNSLQSFHSVNKSPELFSLLGVLANIIQQWGESNATVTISPHSFSSIVYGLRGFSSEDAEVRKVIENINKFIIPKVKPQEDEFPLYVLRDIMYSMRYWSSQHGEVRSYLDSLLNCLQLYPYYSDIMKNNESTQLQSNEGAQTKKFRRLVDSGERSGVVSSAGVVPSVKKEPKISTMSIEQWSCNDVSRAVYGLSKLSSNSKTVCSLLNVLSSLIKLNCKINKQNLLECADIVNICQGLRNIGSQHAEARMLITSLASILEENNKLFLKLNKVYACSPKELALLMYGLRRCSSGSSEVRYLLNGLLPIIGSCVYSITSNSSPTFTCDDAAMILMGLQWMESRHSEVRRIIQLITPMIRSAVPFRLSGDSYQKNSGKELYSSQHVCMILKGLHGFDSSQKETRDLLSIVFAQIRTSTEHMSKIMRGNEAQQGIAYSSAEAYDIQKELRKLTLGKGSKVSTELTEVKLLLKQLGVK